MLAARRTRPLTIAGPRELRTRMDGIREALFPCSHAMAPKFPLDWIEMEPGRATGDTEWTDEVARAARGADLLIAECPRNAPTTAWWSPCSV